MLATVLAGLLARKRRLLGACTAVVLGVAFLTATLVMGDTMRAGFRQAFTDANAGTDVVVRSSTEIGGDDSRVRDVIPADLVDRVAAVEGVAVAAPSITGVGTIIGSDGQRIGGDGPPTTATNWIDDAGLNAYKLAEGRAPAAPDEVVIDRGSANNGDLAVGDRTTILTPAPVEVTVVGIATFGELDSLGPTTYTAFTLDAARSLLLDRPDAVSAVLVAAEEGVNGTTLRDEIAQLLPARIEALTQQELTAEQERDIESDFLGIFEMILLAFAGIALVVATFSIHNTFSILVAQRTRESALLRAIGASRRQVVTAVAAEAFVVGVIAAVVGFGAGLGLAVGLKALMAGAGFDLPVAGIVVGAGTIVIAAAVGIVTTMVASVAPAVSASRVAPLAALRDVAVDRSAASRLRAIVGMLLTAAGAVVVATAVTSSDGAVSRAALGALAVIVGAVVLGPVVARPAAAVLGIGAGAVVQWPLGPPQRDAQPPAHRRQRLGPDGRHRRGGVVHHVRCLAEGIARRCRRQLVRRRPDRPAGRVQRRRTATRPRRRHRGPAGGRLGDRVGAGHGDGQRCRRRADGRRSRQARPAVRPRGLRRIGGRSRGPVSWPSANAMPRTTSWRSATSCP